MVERPSIVGNPAAVMNCRVKPVDDLRGTNGQLGSKEGGFVMDVTVEPMDRAVALQISSWKYNEPFDFYNMDDDAGMNELLDGTYFKVLEKEMLSGYCCFGKSAIVPIGLQFGAYPENGSVDVGLGMRPDLTGHGSGYAFVSAVLEFARSEYNSDQFRLTVAQFNARAIAVYNKLGFKSTHVSHPWKGSLDYPSLPCFSA